MAAGQALSGQAAWVTGSSRGLGRVMAATLCKMGARVAIHGTRPDSPRSFGHTHHTYYQIACLLSLLGKRQAAFEWLERCISTGFACWPLFLKDRCLQNLRELHEFDALVSSLQAKYPDSLGQL